ncbi:hypothetical protein B0T14DRAFT_563956 [Immersiella caudata]|uniref:Uncharacterized protein n=1 Tax=Immersiella caudata TaxID=314043 RepID=A0AA40C2E6_9PEZI|nr:hypothetical protein B0T14DRAFT_563956 [Immersiella caudata]
MKFSVAVRTVAAVSGCLFHLVEAKTAQSSFFGWQYQLDASAPVITAMSEVYATSTAWNDTVSLEVIEGIPSLVDQVSKTQIATLGGALGDWALAEQPTEEQMAAAKAAGVDIALKAGLADTLAAVAAGMSMADALKAHSLDKRDTIGTKEDWKKFMAWVDCKVCLVTLASCKFHGCYGLCFNGVCLPEPGHSWGERVQKSYPGDVFEIDD